MSRDNNFLTIPNQEALFTTIKNDPSEGASSNAADEDDEDIEEDVHLIPRSSPVPRKRGPSIHDETAEYMRIRLALPSRRVAFADTTGGELVDVREFVQFDSDEDDSRWEEEEARYRASYRVPIYRVSPDFTALSGPDLTHAVQTNKVEVEIVSTIADDPLSFSGMVRVLNVSFRKAVYIRSTMDGWITHYDYPADYVEGSNDGKTDQFSFKLCFAAPYLFNGARIDFVVRYETPEKEYWANNSGKNYSVSLLEVDEDTSHLHEVERPEVKGILKPPKFGMDKDYDDGPEEEEETLSRECEEAMQQPTACPAGVQDEIDVQTARVVSNPPPTSTTASTIGGIYAPFAVFDLQKNTIKPSQLQLNALPQLDEVKSLSTFQEAQLYDDIRSAKDDSQNSLTPAESLLMGGDDLQMGISTEVPPQLDVVELSVLPGSSPLEKEMRVSEEKDQVDKEVEKVKSEPNEEIEEEIKGQQTRNLGDVEDTDSIQITEEPTNSSSTNEKVKTNAMYEAEHGLKQRGEDSETEYWPHPQDRNPGKPMVKDDTAVKSEPAVEAEAGAKVKTSLASGEDIPGTVVPHVWQFPGVTHPAGQDMVSHSLNCLPAALVPEPSLPMFLKQQRETAHFGELKTVLSEDTHSSEQQDVLEIMENKGIEEDALVSVVPSCVPEPTASSPDPLTNAEAISPRDENGYRIAKEDVIAYEVVESAYNSFDPTYVPPQSQEVPGNELSPPDKTSPTSEVPVVHPEATLDKTLIPSFVFFSGAILVVLGYHEPSFLLLVGLYLALLCF